MIKVLGSVSAVCLAMAVLCGAASATPVTVGNASFETPDVNSSGTHTVGSPSPWVGSGNQFGIIQPNATYYTAGSDGLSGGLITPDGDQVGYMVGTSSLSQTLSAVFQADEIYTLDLFVGHRLQTNYPGGSFSISLLAGSNVVATKTIADPGLGQWEEVSLGLVTGAGDAFIGQNITILLSSIITVTGQSLNIDNVTLDASACRGRCAVPEPDSMAIFAGGLGAFAMMGMGLYRRRRFAA